MHVLSGGAAAAVVQGVQAQFEQSTGSRIEGTFSAVGMMRDKLVGGAPCDVAIFTKPLIEQLIASGHVVPGSARSLGLVKTGVAERCQGHLLSGPGQSHGRYPFHERTQGLGAR